MSSHSSSHGAAGVHGAALLAAARSAPGYELAWTDPEPLVSVRIATVDNADILVERTLSSVLAQTYERWEAVVVGDAVTDDTAERIARLGDPRIRFHNLPLRGPYPADPVARRLVAGTYPANAGLRMARGSWIAPLDHDDSWAPDHIEVLLSHARSTQAKIAYGIVGYFDVQRGREVPLTIGSYPPELAQFVWQGAILNAALRVFEYDVDAHLLGEPGDWNLARRLLEAGARFSFLDRVVATYYFDAGPGPRRDWLEARLEAKAA